VDRESLARAMRDRDGISGVFIPDSPDRPKQLPALTGDIAKDLRAIPPPPDWVSFPIESEIVAVQIFEDCRLHDLRQTYASRLAMAGVDLLTVKELGGWKSLTMVQRSATRTSPRVIGGRQSSVLRCVGRRLERRPAPGRSSTVTSTGRMGLAAATEVRESKWSRGRKLNPRPADYEGVEALPPSQSLSRNVSKHRAGRGSRRLPFPATEAPLHQVSWSVTDISGEQRDTAVRAISATLPPSPTEHGIEF
jgi:hypothetical protein